MRKCHQPAKNAHFTITIATATSRTMATSSNTMGTSNTHNNAKCDPPINSNSNHSMEAWCMNPSSRCRVHHQDGSKEALSTVTGTCDGQGQRIYLIILIMKILAITTTL